MQLDDAIKTRRSIRKYSLDAKGNPEKIDIEKILEIIDVARYSPMAGGIFSLKFIVVLDREKIKKIAEFCDQPFVADAYCLIIVCTDGDTIIKFYGERGERYLRQQAGAAIQNMLLKIRELNLGSVWIGYFYDEKIKELLKIPDNIFIEAILPIGKIPKNLKLPEKKLIAYERIIYFDEWKRKEIKEKILRH
ncbi:MAG: nitroreductase family protein [Candidatus Pacearchaeota archaeon]